MNMIQEVLILILMEYSIWLDKYTVYLTNSVKS